MIYELWDLPSRNLVATYTSKSEALADLRAALTDHGADYVADFMLGQEDTKGRSRMIARGSRLVALTLASMAESAPSS